MSGETNRDVGIQHAHEEVDAELSGMELDTLMHILRRLQTGDLHGRIKAAEELQSFFEKVSDDGNLDEWLYPLDHVVALEEGFRR